MLDILQTRTGIGDMDSPGPFGPAQWGVVLSAPEGSRRWAETVLNVPRRLRTPAGNQRSSPRSSAVGSAAPSSSKSSSAVSAGLWGSHSSNESEARSGSG